MKIRIKIIELFACLIVFILVVGFRQQASDINELIMGKWVSKDSPEWIWEFKTDGKCYDYYDSQLSDTYMYTIFHEKSKNGKLTHSFLRLVNVNDSQDIYEYEINALGNTKLTLDYLGDMSVQLIYFTKE